MTVREFLQHLTLNGELDSDIVVEVPLPVNTVDEYVGSFIPAHVTQVENETIIECKPAKED